MVFTGEGSKEAEESILSFCVRFGGSPEVTEEGTIVYRFDELLLSASGQKYAELASPIKRLKTFSTNPKNKNTWFIFINAVNLIFGSYFLYNSHAYGLLVSDIQYQAAPSFYAFTHILLGVITANPHGVIFVALGLVPLAFSVLFWLIPAIRLYMEKKENENIKLTNFKRLAFSSIWEKPFNVKSNRFTPSAVECQPQNQAAAGDAVIKALGSLSNPDVEIGSNGETLYSFPGLENEKSAVKKYRSGIDLSGSQLGKTVFDSGE
jgi:hypothetical protein